MSLLTRKTMTAVRGTPPLTKIRLGRTWRKLKLQILRLLTINMSELEEYKEQLAEIEETLTNDPQNEELLALKAELLDLIALLGQDDDKTKEKQETSIPEQPALEKPLLHTESVTPPAEASVPPFTAGQTVWARTKLEKQIKEARVISVSGNRKTVTITFIDSSITESYAIEEIHKERPKDTLNKYKKQQQKATTKPKDDKYEQALNKSAQSWQNFNKKGKKVKKDKSMFSTSDAIGSKVGVVGSGKPMSEKKKVHQHRFSPY